MTMMTVPMTRAMDSVMGGLSSTKRVHDMCDGLYTVKNKPMTKSNYLPEEIKHTQRSSNRLLRDFLNVIPAALPWGDGRSQLTF